MKGIMIFADGFEDIEALGTLDLLRRASLEVDTISLTGKLDILTQSKINLKADKLYSEISLNDYDFLIIPGGGAVKKFHQSSEITKEIVNFFMAKNCLVACICAAPTMLGLLGYLKGCDYVCYPGCESESFGGNYQINKKVVVCKNMITSKACGTTFEFSYEIIKYLVGPEIADKVLNSVYY